MCRDVGNMTARCSILPFNVEIGWDYNGPNKYPKLLFYMFEMCTSRKCTYICVLNYTE